MSSPYNYKSPRSVCSNCGDRIIKLSAAHGDSFWRHEHNNTSRCAGKQTIAQPAAVPAPESPLPQSSESEVMPTESGTTTSDTPAISASLKTSGLAEPVTAAEPEPLCIECGCPEKHWIHIGKYHPFAAAQPESAAKVEEIARKIAQYYVSEYAELGLCENVIDRARIRAILRPYITVSQPPKLQTRFDEFDNSCHPCNEWWQKHGQFMMSGGGRREFIWACRGWIAHEQFAQGVEVTGDSLHEASPSTENTPPKEKAK